MSRMPFWVAAFFALCIAAPLDARSAQCDTRIDGEPVTIFYSTEDPEFASLRDRLFTRGRACPADIVITYLLPDLTAAERTVFCANYDRRTGSHSQPAQGRRDAYGRCVEPSRTCELVNTSKETALEIMGLGRQTGAADRYATLTSVLHWSGAMILSGNAGTLTNLLTSAGSSVGTALGSPAVLAGTAASVVVIGGMVWLCSDAG